MSKFYEFKILLLYFSLVNISESLNITADINDYFAKRQAFLSEETNLALGADIELDENEIQVNDILKTLKLIDLQNGLINPLKFTPSRHFFEVMNNISDSKLFQLIRKMPKGGVLHAHDTALASVNFIVEGILYNPKYMTILWYCSNNKNESSVKFKFSREKPEVLSGFEDWVLLADARKNSANIKTFDEILRKRFTLFTKNPLIDFKDINDVWLKFLNIFKTFDPIVRYLPVWEDYFMQALVEFREDGVQYLEFRGLLPEVYDLDGTNYTKIETFQIYKKVLDNFKLLHTDFVGAKFIYGPNRNVNNKTFKQYISTVKNLKKTIPDFLAGFDLVGQEDSGTPLKHYINHFLELKATNPEIKFFFHAGETNWNGMATDENLIDAILLGTQRIGHGFAVLKHPNVMKIIKDKNIAIEINPISNQVLKLVADNRNHPCSHLFADNYPVVISSDDPSFWEANPLSHDFYIAFMGIASAHSDLKLLKKLAQNSIEYSAMNEDEKIEALRKWQKSWKEFIDFVNSNRAYFI